MPQSKATRSQFTKEHDTSLFKYLAKHCPTKAGRHGNTVYDKLVANKGKKWPWSVYHTSESWRERYVKNADHFDKFILNYQKRYDMMSEGNRKRSSESVLTEMSRPDAKRIRLEKKEKEEKEGGEVAPTTSETFTTTQHEHADASKPNPPAGHPEPPALTSIPPERTSTHLTSPVTSPPRSNAKATSLKNVAYSPTPVQVQQEILEIPSSPPDRQPPPATNGVPESDTSPRHVKRIKVRYRSPSDVFASDPPSPGTDVTAVPVVSVEGSSSSQARSVLRTGVDGAPNSPAVYLRAPPRFVNSFHGRIMVDRDGRVPHALSRGEKVAEDEQEEEGEEDENEKMKEKEEKKGQEEKKEQDKEQWPPIRGGAAKRGRISEPDAAVDVHHAFSQPHPSPWSDALRKNVGIDERERAPTVDGMLLDRRTVAARFSGRARHDTVPQVSSEDVVQNDASPVKRIVTAAPPLDPFSGHIPKPLSNVFKFPAPCPSTRSPFRLEPPAPETHQLPPLSQPRLQSRPRSSRTRLTRHSALTRAPRQTVDHKNKRAREDGREVPSLDLVALSHSSTSRSRSHSSGDTSVPARPPRWSLPAFAHTTPWVFDEPERRAASSAYGDPWRGPRQTSTPRFTWTSSPARTIVGTRASATNDTSSYVHARANGVGIGIGAGIGIPALPSTSLVPHPPDLQLVVSHGLASILAHMSANHGLALNVVEAVYERVGSLRETDEVLGGMREAAAGFGEREIERRIKERRRVERSVGSEERGRGSRKSDLRYVIASEDGEGSEYSPPETSRAAMWKRQSESSHAEQSEEKDEEEEVVEAGEDDNNEAEEGREVEEELWDREGDEDKEDGPHHDFSRRAPAENDGPMGQEDAQFYRDDAWKAREVTEAMLEDTKVAHKMEKKLGKEHYRRGIARLFR